jgi:hypothetical protein
MESDVGLLIVHGIGNQKSGSLARIVCDALGGGPTRTTSSGSNVAVAAVDPDNADVHRMKIGERTVYVCEAHWADLSSPDNTPELRIAGYLPRDFLQTVAHAWQAFALRTFFPGKEVKPLSIRGFLAIAVVIALAGAALVATFRTQPGSEMSDWLAFAIGVSLAAFLVTSVIRYTRKSLATVRVRLQSRPAIVQSAVVVLCLPFVILIGYILFFVLLFATIFSIELLVFLAVLVALTAAVNQVGLMLALILQDISTGLDVRRFDRIRRWINRLSWAVLVFPLQSLTQTSKAWIRLVSVVFARHAPTTRWAAGLMIPAIYFAALLLLLVSAIVVALVTSPFNVLILPGDVGVVARLVFAIVSLALVLGVVRMLLPVLDLLLDISNYHLATSSERDVYFARLQLGLERLKRIGCREIHVLAHSLGTVITYEWLAREEKDYASIAVLHTIGSPLDKFWFTDHPESQRFSDETGAKISGNLRWYNYWAWSDPVSGHLDHFGRSRGLVQNIRLKWLGVFLYSHIRYWTCPQVVQGVRAGLKAEAVP